VKDGADVLPSRDAATQCCRNMPQSHGMRHMSECEVRDVRHTKMGDTHIKTCVVSH